MEALLNVLWDYRVGGFYVSRGPLRYRVRMYLENRVIPALKAMAAAAKPHLVMAAELAAFAILWTLYQLCRGLSWLGRQARYLLEITNWRGIVRDAFRVLGLREVWQLLLFGTPIVLLVGTGAVLLGLLALAGLGAGRVVNWFDEDEFGGAE